MNNHLDHIPRSKRVVEHNDLVNARYDFPVLIHRLFIAGLLLIDKDDDDLKTYHIPIRELIDAYDLSSKAYYSELKDRAEELLKRSNLGFERISKNGKRGWDMFPLFSKLSYVEGEGYIEVGFNPQLRPQLIDFKNNFTQYELEYVRSFASQYSFRIYKWLKQIESLREDRTMTVENLRALLVLDEKYPNFKDLRVNVIEVAQSELDEHADISFDWEPAKREGRKILAIRLKIRLSERSRKGLGPLFERSAELKQLGVGEGPADAFERWLDGLSEADRAALEAEADTRLTGSTSAGVVRMMERDVQMRAIYAERRSP